MYVKKVTKNHYYKWLIILPILYLFFEILDSIFLNEPLDYGKIISSSIGAAIGMYLSYSRDLVKMNDTGEIVIEDEFSRQLTLEFSQYYLFFLGASSFLIFEIFKWTRTKEIPTHYFDLILFILFFSYFIGLAIYIKIKS
ncbi:hypothetical protein RW115_06875 [Macrococcus capreoli]